MLGRIWERRHFLIASALFFLVVVLTCGASALPPKIEPVDDCQANTVLPAGFTRVFIAAHGSKDGSGKAASDPRDGSTADKFDGILRCFAEGCSSSSHPTGGTNKTDNLIVCMSPGTFQTKGTYDFTVNVPHKSAEGFTIGKGWKIHGAGKNKTTVQLSAYLPAAAAGNPRQLPATSATGLVFSTYSDDASDIEISDLTVDANYPGVKAQAAREGIKALNLEAIHLRSDRGHNWIHDVNVVHTSGEIGSINEKWETFPVWIYSVKANSTPKDNNGNVIERVSMSDYSGGQCTAIAVANAQADVRNNRVEGYQIGYGGWTLSPVSFHDNVAIGTEYGFNIDSLVNNDVHIEHNQIIHPTKYGIVVGGAGTYNHFTIKDNTIEMDASGAIGLVFQGNVTNTVVAGNNFLWRPSGTLQGFVGATAIRNFSNGRSAGANRDNNYQGNKISAKLNISFKGPSKISDNCVWGNRDENGRALRDFVDNRKNGCVIFTGASVSH